MQGSSRKSEETAASGLQTWIALLRGINVGGQSKLPMQQLAETLRRLGLQRVTTYVQSGNVVFQGPPIVPARLAEQIGTAISSQFGFRPPILLISREALFEVLNRSPFLHIPPDDKTVHCFFLFAAATAPDIDGLNAVTASNERWALRDNVLYLHAPDGFGRSKFAASVEKRVGVPTTARNWRTLTHVYQLADALR
jgi:uncharacterized protein (DUF1697 family)